MRGGRPSSLVSDGAHSNGTAGFFFLPPVVSNPSVSGTLDTDIAFVNPVVAICDITDGPDVGCGAGTPGSTPAIRSFTTTTDPAIAINGDKYTLNWDTGDGAFVAGRIYRVHVFAGPGRTELGFADVVLASKPGQIKNHNGDMIALNDGRTLPIHFRIEQGVVPREGPAQSLSVGGLSDPVVAGTAGSITVTARDANGGVVTGYRGTIALASGDPQATLPESYTFTAADAGTHTFESVTLRTAGGVTITATDQANASITGAQSVTVTPAAAATLLLAEVPPQRTAGVASGVTVIVLDQFGNTVPGYTGTVRFASSDPNATLPADYEFQTSDGGVHSFPGSVTFKTAGTQTLSATDVAVPATTGSAATTVAPGAPAELRFTAQPSNTVAFEAIAPAVIVTVYDAFGNQATNFTGFVRMGIETNPTGAVLFGTFDVRAVAGVVTYTELTIVDPASGYTLAASLLSGVRVVSAPFDILAQAQ